jgi:hypothetical protein
MKRARKLYALTLSALAFAYLATAIGTQVYVRARALPELDAGREKIERLEPRILADLKLLAEKPVFAKSAREKNAERFLTGFITWSGAEALHSAEHDRLIESMGQHQDVLKSEENWSAFVADEAIYDLDLAWVDQLTAYDSIDIATHPRYLEILARAEDAHGIARLALWNELPIPQFGELRFAALARAAQLAREKQPQEGLSLYHHVSDLMSTSDSLIGSLSAVLMLQNEKKLADHLDTKWTPVDDERIDAMKRTSWMWPGLMRDQAVTGTLGSFEAYFSRDTNACTWIHELTGIELVLSDYLQPTLVFEPNLNERLERERGILTKALNACEHPDLMAFFSPVKSPLMIGRGIPNPARIPFVRRVIGLDVALMATPNYFRIYEESPRQPASD